MSEKTFSILSLLSLSFAILGLFIRPLCIFAIASGVAALVQISKTPELKFKKATKLMAIMGVALGSITAIFLIMDLIMGRGVFKSLTDFRDDLIAYFGNKSKGFVGNISDLTNTTGGLEGI